MPAACRMDGEIAMSRLHLDSVHSPTLSRFLSVSPSIVKILLAQRVRVLCSVIFHINHVIAFFYTYSYMTISKIVYPVATLNFVVYIVNVRVTCPLSFVVDTPLVW